MDALEKLKIIIWGTGQYWKNRKKYILDSFDIVCFLDNNHVKWNQELCGKIIDKPNNVLNYEFDYILIMCKSQEEIFNQAINLGVSRQKIVSYNQFKQMGLKSYFVKYGEHKSKCYDVIVISTILDYNGGTMAVVYAVKALQAKGKKVLLCAEDCSEKLLSELITDDIEIMIVPSLPITINDELMNCIEKCQMVLVNVFQMLPVVCQINGKKPVLWWIHEPANLYDKVMQEFPQYKNSKLTSQINCIAVSRIPQKNFFEKYFRDIHKTMAYGIPDMTISETSFEKKKNKIVFAIVGSVIERKAQDIFVESIKSMDKSELQKADFYIIGLCANDIYGKQITQNIKGYNNIYMLGNLTRAEMNKIYHQIDVVVCPSREDPLPIVMTEAMMYGKPCIASDSTGTADYIDNGVNGFVCKTEDAEDLCEKMRYFIHNPERIKEMGQEARKVYEEYFTMDKFADRLCAAMDETINLFNNDK